MKRLIVCCDGTWNKPEQLNNGLLAPTNVSKLALAIAREDDQGTKQIVHYQRGVGTRAWEKLRGGALGAGLSRNVRDCYAFLVESYEPGDQLFFFGFSRGAFTARSLGGLVRNSGILLSHHRARIDDAYRLYRSPDKNSEPGGLEASMFRRLYAHELPDIEFVGVWDTVGALGIPAGPFLPAALAKRWSFHNTELSSHVRHAYHAIAIDERRAIFEPALWIQQPDAPAHQKLEQVWFAGAHCDIGGGYGDTGLSDIALLWMVGKAKAAGLALDPQRLVETDPADENQRRAGVQVCPRYGKKPADSMTTFYRLLGVLDRKLSDKKGTRVDGLGVASSAGRLFRGGGYDPPGLREYVDGAEPRIVPVAEGR
ncbi:MAG TPA: DUF2235 domain-containing protein [Solirubrobacteraceae bacterium]|nr:DUF2235 domain-containing protein [Solirubrobacteraceae bacterium]